MNRYAQIHSQIWFDEKIQALDDDCKLLFIYLLTSPHSNMIGYYRLPIAYAAVDIHWDIKRAQTGFDKLVTAKIIKYDLQTSVILILNYLKYNPIQGENQAKGAVKQAQDVPKSPLLYDFIECIKKHVPDYLKLFETLLEGIRTPFEPPSKPLAGSGTGTGTGTDINNTYMCASAVAECVINTTAEKTSDTTEDGGAQQKECAKTASAGKGEDYTPDFEQFWSLYPRKVEKKKAFRVWNARLKEKIDPQDMITAAHNYAMYCKNQNIEPRYIKHPGTFLGPDKPFTDFIKGVVINGAGERYFNADDGNKREPRDKLFARALD